MFLTFVLLIEANYSNKVILDKFKIKFTYILVKLDLHEM